MAQTCGSMAFVKRELLEKMDSTDAAQVGTVLARAALAGQPGVAGAA